jgi:hypothetical protein
LPELNLTTDPNSYLQPLPTAVPRDGSASQGISNQAPIFTSPAPSLTDQSPASGGYPTKAPGSNDGLNYRFSSSVHQPPTDLAGGPLAPLGWSQNQITHGMSYPDGFKGFEESTPGSPEGWRADPRTTIAAPSIDVTADPNGLLTPPGKQFEKWKLYDGRPPEDPDRNQANDLDYFLQITPPHTLEDLGKARQEEIDSSPTSAAYAAKLAQVAKDTGYTVNWHLNANPNEDQSVTKPDYEHKQINIYINQKSLSGGTFGHESDHAIRMMLADQAMGNNPPSPQFTRSEHAVYLNGINAKVSSDPFFQNNYEFDTPHDAKENQGTRVGNLIIAERLAQHQLDRNGVPLSERIGIQPSQIMPIERFNDNTNLKHPENDANLPAGTRYGTHGFDMLHQEWQNQQHQLYPDR